MAECGVLHPELNLPCEENEASPHEQHAAFLRGWKHWPNEDFVPPPTPLDPAKDLAKVVKIVREDRKRVAHANPTPAEGIAAFSGLPTAPARRKVLYAIASVHPRPVTKNSIADQLGWSRDRTHPRMRELELDGIIVKTGEVQSGTDADGDLWILTPEALGELGIS